MFCLVIAFILAGAALPALAQDNDFFVYVGTYTGFKWVHHSKPYGFGESHSKGIYVSRFHAATGELSEPQLAAEAINPSFLTISPDHKFLYAVSEDPLSLGPPLDHSSYVSAFAIDPATGKLRLLNTAPASGTSTCYISMDRTGTDVFMANFGSGSVSVIRVRPDGSLGELTALSKTWGAASIEAIQNEPHPHSIGLRRTTAMLSSPTWAGQGARFPFRRPNWNTFAARSSLRAGLSRRGPRHFTFDPSGRFGYQLGEMSGPSTCSPGIATRGVLTTSSGPRPCPMIFSAAITVPRSRSIPTENFLYESNRRTQE